MPNIKSAKKRMKQAEGRRVANKAEKSSATTAQKTFEASLEAGDAATSKKLYSKLCSVLDKGVKHGVIKANTASRRKSRAARKLASMGAETAPA